MSELHEVFKILINYGANLPAKKIKNNLNFFFQCNQRAIRGSLEIATVRRKSSLLYKS